MKTKNILISFFLFLFLAEGIFLIGAKDSDLVLYTASSSIDNSTGANDNNSTSVRIQASKVAPYYESFSANPDSNFSASTFTLYGDSTGFDLIGKGHANRVIQTCNISYLTLYLDNVDELTDFRVKIWTKNETTGLFTLRVCSDNYASLLCNGTFNLYFNPELPAVEGDYIGLFLKGRGNEAFPCIQIGNSSEKYSEYLSNIAIYHGSMPDTEAGWEVWDNVTTYPGILQAEAYTCDPVGVVWIGDSIFSGFPLNAAFTNQPVDLHFYTSAPEKTIPYKFQEYYNISYQNLGIHGDSYPNLWYRFDEDVISKRPTFAVIEGGVNNLKANLSVSEIFDYIKLQVVECQENRITPIVILCLPTRGYLGLTQNLEADKLNKMILDYHAGSNQNFALVDARGILGEWDPDNGWYLYPEYASDDVHLTESGNEVLAKAVYDRLPAVCISPNNGTRIYLESAENTDNSENLDNNSYETNSSDNNSSINDLSDINFTNRNDSNITFTWTSTSLGPYRLQVACDPEFTQIIYDNNFSEQNRSVPFSTGEYWWRIGAYSRDWSIAKSFKVI